MKPRAGLELLLGAAPFPDREVGAPLKLVVGPLALEDGHHSPTARSGLR